MQQVGKPTRAVALGAVTLVAGLAATEPASAQAWIGAMAGQMAAEQAEAQKELACRKGAPPSPKQVAKVNAKIEQLMQDYSRLTPQSDPKAISKVFVRDMDDARFEDAHGAVPLSQVASRLGQPMPQRTLMTSVVAGDTQSARAIWTAPAADPKAPPVVYAVDFFDQFGWRIRRMLVTAQPAAPDAPAGYCHYDPDQGF